MFKEQTILISINLSHTGVEKMLPVTKIFATNSHVARVLVCHKYCSKLGH